jgi:DNA replication factor GINS
LDEFFQNLREIQKKERSLSGLSSVGDDFYGQISSYFNRLMERIDNNPFSFESYLLRDAQRIVAEICERREHKIANSVVMNVQRSYQLFKDVQEDGRPNIPLNSTPEEEKLYLELYRSLATYRQEMRSPLRSYSQKKDQKSSIASTSINDSENSEKGVSGIIEDDFTQKKDNINVEVDEGVSISKKIIPPPGVDEIPPEIQDEIYKQFGKEPVKQNSQDSSIASKKDKGDATSNSTKDLNDEVDVDPVKSDNELSNLDDLRAPKTFNEVLMILDELPSIMGVDSNVYGPFYPGDIITMPEPNARILIKNHKGKSIQRYK